jgi:hypothetical protein
MKKIKVNGRGLWVMVFFILFIAEACAATDTTIKGTTTTSGQASLEVTNSANTTLLYARNDGNTGVGTSSPNVKLDVNGDAALRRTDFTAANGTNSNISIGSFSFVKISGPTAAFTIASISGGQDGKFVILYNSTGQNMTLANDTGTAANRILTNTGADVSTTGTGSAMLIYDSGASRWILINLEQ